MSRPKDPYCIYVSQYHIGTSPDVRPEDLLLSCYLCRCQSIQVRQEPGGGRCPQVPGRKREAGEREGDDSDRTDGLATGEERAEGSHSEQPRYLPRCWGTQGSFSLSTSPGTGSGGGALTQISWFPIQEGWALPQPPLLSFTLSEESAAV